MTEPPTRGILARSFPQGPQHGRPDDAIAIGVGRNHSQVVVRIRETGDGVDPATLTRIFDLFTKGDHADGFGISLSVVKRLVELHGGVVEAHSEGRGSGSEFIVRLPVASVTES